LSTTDSAAAASSAARRFALCSSCKQSNHSNQLNDLFHCTGARAHHSTGPREGFALQDGLCLRLQVQRTRLLQGYCMVFVHSFVLGQALADLCQTSPVISCCNGEAATRGSMFVLAVCCYLVICRKRNCCFPLVLYLHYAVSCTPHLQSEYVFICWYGERVAGSCTRPRGTVTLPA
jgi:hypothetical protein